MRAGVGQASFVGDTETQFVQSRKPRGSDVRSKHVPLFFSLPGTAPLEVSCLLAHCLSLPVSLICLCPSASSQSA